MKYIIAALVVVLGIALAEQLADYKESSEPVKTAVSDPPDAEDGCLEIMMPKIGELYGKTTYMTTGSYQGKGYSIDIQRAPSLDDKEMLEGEREALKYKLETIDKQLENINAVHGSTTDNRKAVSAE